MFATLTLVTLACSAGIPARSSAGRAKGRYAPLLMIYMHVAWVKSRVTAGVYLLQLCHTNDCIPWLSSRWYVAWLR
jgi:hypothetical protein